MHKTLWSPPTSSKSKRKSNRVHRIINSSFFFHFFLLRGKFSHIVLADKLANKFLSTEDAAGSCLACLIPGLVIVVLLVVLFSLWMKQVVLGAAEVMTTLSHPLEDPCGAVGVRVTGWEQWGEGGVRWGGQVGPDEVAPWDLLCQVGKLTCTVAFSCWNLPFFVYTFFLLVKCLSVSAVVLIPPMCH